MGEAENRRAVERLVEGLNAKNVEIMNEVFLDDSVISWPQSGEVVQGQENAKRSMALSPHCRPSPRTGWS
jgi:hypothetical protein